LKNYLVIFLLVFIFHSIKFLYIFFERKK